MTTTAPLPTTASVAEAAEHVAPHVRLIHSVASESALHRLEQHPTKEILIQVNVAGEEGKAGIVPEEIGEFITRSPVPVTGLMTMPPFVERPLPHIVRLVFEQVVRHEHDRHRSNHLRDLLLTPDPLLQGGKGEWAIVAEREHFPVEHGALGQPRCRRGDFREAVRDQFFTA